MNNGARFLKMFRRNFLIGLSIFFIGFGQLGFADDIVELKAEHGKELKSAPFVIRYKFQNATGSEWKDSTYDQRKKFLTKWYADLKREHIAQAKFEKEQDKQERSREYEKRKLEMQNDRNLRYQEKVARAEQTAEEKKQKEFNNMTNNQERLIEKLRQEQEQSRFRNR